VDLLAVAYLNAHLQHQDVRLAPVAHAPSGRTATARDQAVPVEIIARIVVVRQGGSRVVVPILMGPWVRFSFARIQLRDAFGPPVYQSSIPHSVRVEEAHARNVMVAEFLPRSAPALAYESLLAEVLDDGDEQRKRSGPTIDPHAADELTGGETDRPGRSRRSKRAG
jgi:hypothetical protein